MWCEDLIHKYYADNPKLEEILLHHSRQVAYKAVGIAKAHPELHADVTFLFEAAMLHDIGIYLCNAPGICCYGASEYICHGYLGAELLRKEGYPRHADVAERHTGTGITLEQIERENLPIPHQDFCPRTIEEQIVCYADKFYSKSNLTRPKSLGRIRSSLARYGEESVEKFNEWHLRFRKTRKRQSTKTGSK